MVENKQFVLERYPTAYAQENDGYWDINIDSQQGLVDGADDNLESEAEAWERAAKEIAVDEATLDAAWRYLNDREDEEGDTDDWDKGKGSMAKAAVVTAGRLFDCLVKIYDSGDFYGHDNLADENSLGSLVEEVRRFKEYGNV